MSKLIVAVVKSIMNINKKNCIAQGPAQILNDLMHPHLPPLPIKQLITRGVCHNTPNLSDTLLALGTWPERIRSVEVTLKDLVK